MDKYRHPSGMSANWYSEDASLTAESLRTDFSGLIEIFDRHLDALPPNDTQARLHISQAKAAAERGLKLSHELIAQVKTATANST